jgi:hypothetical protein
MDCVAASGVACPLLSAQDASSIVNRQHSRRLAEILLCIYMDHPEATAAAHGHKLSLYRFLLLLLLLLLPGG